MKKKLKQLIDENFEQTDLFDDNEEDFTVKTSVNEILGDEIEDFPPNAGPTLFSFKSSVFPADVLPESPKKRNVVSNVKDFYDSPSEDDSGDERESEDGDSADSEELPEEISSKNPNKRVKFNLPDDENDDESDDGEIEESEDRESKESEDGESKESENDESDESADSDESDIEDDVESGDDSQNDVDMASVFSKNTLDNSLELRKAAAVTNQLTLFDNLMENRILLQKCISDLNKFSPTETSLSPLRKNSIEYLEKYLTKLIELQKKLRRETTGGEHIEDEDYDTFRNKSIENWYNRTKGARTNFTAFEAPLVNKVQDLVQKTYVTRTEAQENADGGNSIDSTMQVDFETVNDDDFYHKLLRHYIKRKTANISDSTQLGRQWIKLQNLRSKMKRKIDTRKTKGRKIKFDPHNKLINFMAVQNLRKWADEPINELFSSVFGNKILNSG